MEKQLIEHSISINASKQKIWSVLLDDRTYRLWTSVFHPGSYAEGDWETGSKVYFKTPEGDGMVSNVVTHKPEEIISFEHVGILKDNQVIYDHPEIEKWKGLNETYKLSALDDHCLLVIEADIADEYYDLFNEKWEQALQKVKALSEND